MKTWLITAGTAILFLCGPVNGEQKGVAVGDVLSAIGTIKDKVMGETTIYAKSGLERADWRDKVTRTFPPAPIFGWNDYAYEKEYRYVSIESWIVKRSNVTGMYNYSRTYTEPRYDYKKNVWIMRDLSFTIPYDFGLCRLDCKWMQEGVWEHNAKANFSVRVWIDQVEHTGLWPASGPYTVQVAYGADPTCSRYKDGTNPRYFREEFTPDIGKSQVKTIGWVGFCYHDPGMWVGSWLKIQPGND